MMDIFVFVLFILRQILHNLIIFCFVFVSVSEHSRIFSGNNTHTDYFKTLLRDGNNILIGAR